MFFMDYKEVISKLNESLRQLENKVKICEKDDDDTLNKKRRHDIIYRINNKGVVPKSSTLLKYNIQYDTDKKTYI